MRFNKYGINVLTSTVPKSTHYCDKCNNQNISIVIIHIRNNYCDFNSLGVKY